jgi:hypothetical protein
MKAPKPVHTRKIALIREMGFDESLATEDGFTAEGFTVLGAYEFKDRATVIINHGEMVRTFIEWPPELVSRARDAIREDFIETFGGHAAANEVAFHFGR